MDTPVTIAPPPTDARWEAVQRVAASASFQRSPRLRELLSYICQKAIENRPDELREQQIGRGVFGRRPDYSPGEDNIVRVEIRHLRKRLEEYFAAEGKDEPLVILIPKGGYVPVFELRQPAPAAEMVAESAGFGFGRASSKWAPYAVILVLAGACGWLWWENRAAARQLSAAIGETGDSSPLWPLLFNDSHQTFIVCADSTLVVARSILRRPIPFENYVSGELASPGELAPEAAGLMRLLHGWQFTDMADVRLVQRIYRLNARHWDQAVLRSAKTTQIQEFKNGNIILLGSNRSNPWNSLFEPVLNFHFDFDDKTRTPFIRNQAPLAGERSEYRGATPGATGESYSIIALAPNLRHTGNVLIIAGTTGEGTEATGEFLTNPKASAGLIKMLLEHNHGRLPYFEVLLRSTTLAGVAKNAEVVATRILPGEITKSGEF